MDAKRARNLVIQYTGAEVRRDASTIARIVERMCSFNECVWHATAQVTGKPCTCHDCEAASHRAHESNAGTEWVAWARVSLDHVAENVRDRACALAYRPGSMRYEFGASVNGCLGADPGAVFYIRKLLGDLAINIAAG